jgi:hypothetical protein
MQRRWVHAILCHVPNKDEREGHSEDWTEQKVGREVMRGAFDNFAYQGL